MFHRLLYRFRFRSRGIIKIKERINKVAIMVIVMRRMVVLGGVAPEVV